MGVIDQIKQANAARRMFARLCNKCKMRLTQEFAAEYKRQQQTGETSLSPEEVVTRTRSVLCGRCQEVYTEALENR